ncbi:hypothetical protein [Texcoconibacillus texcoconensis]|uniref:Uncharacterized protein n=1 Tax=Texcoconibacillus texcoconensis TaxID=1095777 RepID=A0A840QR74_9BACI|nr:hypothetical protein [Texcoconibacillus texcoconensis]MBB5173864.1 hypothetical protein [Texcoconibacillus texcoconensis]
MSAEYYYNFCQQHMGQEVEITDHHGKVHVGKIEKVDRENVYLRTQAPPPTDRGYGMFFFPLAVGALVAIPLIGIAGARRRPYY